MKKKTAEVDDLRDADVESDKGTQNKRQDKSETAAQRATSRDYWNKIMSLKDEDEPKAIKPKRKKALNCR
jgi:hypothetical protein